MRPRRWMLMVTGSLGPLLLALVWAEVVRSRATAKAVGPAPLLGQPLMVLHHHLERVRKRSGEVSWQFVANRVEVIESGDYLIEGLERGEYLSDNHAEVVFSGDRARLDSRTHNIAVRDNVQVTASRGLSFRAEAMSWFDAEGKLVVPQVSDLSWRDPQQPDGPRATLETQRLFLWPRQQVFELPDRVVGRYREHAVEAAAATGWVKAGHWRLSGPAQLAALAPVDTAAGGQAAPKRVILGVGSQGYLLLNHRTQGAVAKGGVTVSVPADRVDATCDAATYSGQPSRRLTATGKVALHDPANALTAPGAVIDTVARRADFAGPVRLTHSEAGSAPLDLRTSRLSYWYSSGKRRAVAPAPVELTSGTVSGAAARATVDLEGSTAMLTGRVRLRHVPPGGVPPGTREADRPKHEPVTLHSERVEHRFAAGGRRSIADAAPRFYQADREGRARRIEWDHEAESLLLQGDVRIWNKNTERVHCQRLTYDNRTQETRIEAPAKAEFLLREER